MALKATVFRTLCQCKEKHRPIELNIASRNWPTHTGLTDFFKDAKVI